jgi:hypothetical protein
MCCTLQGEGAKQLVPLGTIPLATIEKVTKLVSSRNYKFWLSSKSLMLSNSKGWKTADLPFSRDVSGVTIVMVNKTYQ